MRTDTNLPTQNYCKKYYQIFLIHSIAQTKISLLTHNGTIVGPSNVAYESE